MAGANELKRQSSLCFDRSAISKLLIISNPFPRIHISRNSSKINKVQDCQLYAIIYRKESCATAHSIWSLFYIYNDLEGFQVFHSRMPYRL